MAASRGFIFRFIHLSTKTFPLTHSTFLHPKSRRCNGVIMVICLQETARVRIFSPNTKNGDGNFEGKFEQFTDDL